MKVLKKNQLAILVIALMLITAGYLNYTTNEDVVTTTANTNEQIAAIGDATLVNSGEIIEEKDKQSMLNNIDTANNEISKNTENNTIKNENEIVNENAVTTNNVSNTEDDYFAKSKLERDKMYSQMLGSYQKLLESDTVSQEQKAISQQEINKINQTKNAIMIAENLIATKGFENSIIFVNNDSVSIIVKAEKLEIEQIAQIQNIISRELKVEISNINISNR
ncbi:MAG: SpoIIIAH-like family protein [Clostridia bacterium]|jgi:stage III sporulation protein AH|nr:SpoIIIAH-like family protein [Clostridia bacterium]